MDERKMFAPHPVVLWTIFSDAVAEWEKLPKTWARSGDPQLISCARASNARLFCPWIFHLHPNWNSAAILLIQEIENCDKVVFLTSEVEQIESSALVRRLCKNASIGMFAATIYVEWKMVLILLQANSARNTTREYGNFNGFGWLWEFLRPATDDRAKKDMLTGNVRHSICWSFRQFSLFTCAHIVSAACIPSIRSGPVWLNNEIRCHRDPLHGHLAQTEAE